MNPTLEILVGKTLTKVERSKTDEEIIFTVTDGEQYKLYHSQDCCETVVIKDVCGDLNDLVGAPLLQATEATNSDPKEKFNTWTFYRFATIKGSVVISWEGESNGYYSETVDFAKV